ncbi:outer membrane efflux protein [Gillisia sp. Hel_I_86]|uniref:TolC family protein n=1 Tax=Gillisia sp. Hel_I_86 TaxID=1249981 RepID=UPI00119A43E8|nr:TolC family protein [Gillisia sp. Hel_I_86]TVZ27687.1 outer membrane efflux protein [Gillisia sp. Hel_I_86]
MKQFSLLLLFVLFTSFLNAQQKVGLDYFIENGQKNAPALLENGNLQEIGKLQNDLIKSQNNAFKVNATSEVLVAPYFNNNGSALAITTTPSSNAFGYDVGITNGGLYSSQINITKNLFNQAVLNNLLFQNKISNNSLVLSSEEFSHNLIKNISEAYIIAYQLQLQEKFNRELLKDMGTRLIVVELLVKKGILMESDYLLLELDVEGKKLELQQLESSFTTAINQLYTLSGFPVEAVDELTIPNFEQIESPLKKFYEQRFENDSLQLEADRAVFENQYKPQVSVYANGGLNAVELNNIEHKIGASAGLRLTIPIYDGNQRKINSLQSQLKQDNLKYYKQNSNVQYANNLRNIAQQMEALNANKMALENQLKKQQNILGIYKGKLVQGQISIVDYLNVVQNYKQNVYAKLQMQTNNWLLQSEYNFINW